MDFSYFDRALDDVVLCTAAQVWHSFAHATLCVSSVSCDGAFSMLLTVHLAGQRHESFSAA